MSIEETFRDWPTGWGVRTAVRALPTATRVERLIGVVCLTYSLQLRLGQRLSEDPAGHHRRQQWTVTDRVSWFCCGQRIFIDPGYDWSAWLAAQWATLSIPHAPVVPEPGPVLVLDEAA